MKKSLLLSLLLILFSQITYSQTQLTKLDFQNQSQNDYAKCGTEAYMEMMMQDPDFQAEFLERQAIVAQKVSESQQQQMPPCSNPLIIPVAVHYNNPVTGANQQCLIDAAQAQIDQLNLDYSNCNSNADMLCSWINAGCTDFGGTAGADAMPSQGACIQFCLGDQNLPAGEDNIGNFAITVGDYDWPSVPGTTWDDYLNIFVSNSQGPNILGIAPLGGAATPNGNGVYVLAGAFGSQTFGGCTSGTALGNAAPYNGGATCTHEIGHYFGLEHNWSDNLADTPPAPGPNYGCPTVNTNTCTSSAGADYSGNFMDYVDDDCMHNFTADQVTLMQATAANQAAWATNSISCFGNVTYPACESPAGACILVCPAAVTTPIDLSFDFCGTSTFTTFPDPNTVGLVLDNNSDATYSWSTGGYLSAGGTAVTAPVAFTSTNCSVAGDTYYLNIDCATTPLSPTLDGGTIVITVYPAPPADISTLVVVSGEGTCDAPVVDPIAGCESYITITADGANPNFPVNAGDSGTANFTVEFVSNPDGPECCVIGNPDDEGEIIVNGDFEAGVGTWIESEEVPLGVPNPSPFGIIGVSGGQVNGTNDAWFGGWGGSSYLTITQNITIPACSTVELSFDYLIGLCGANSDYLAVEIGGIVVANIPCDDTNTTFGPVDVIALGVTPGATQIVVIGEENSGSNTNIFVDNVSLIAGNCTTPADCTVTVSGAYNCMEMECTNCNDASCTEVIPCDDGDCNTASDEVTVLISDNNVVCVPCAGLPVPPPNCDDADCSTIDSYDSATCNCVFTPDPNLPLDCNDNDCSTIDAYDATTCSCTNTPDPNLPLDCDDNDCSTVDAYDAATCSCTNTPDPNLPLDCDDNDCSTVDAYDAANCSCTNTPDPNLPLDCDDNDCSTVDAYDAATCSCTNTPDPNLPLDCDDNDCSTIDTYDAATCSCSNVADPQFPLVCDDGDCSTIDAYDPATCSCTYTPDPDLPLDCDDNDCTTADSYDSSNCACVNTPIPPPSCDDNDCTTTDTYNTTTCLCENVTDTPPDCDDSDCTTNDTYDTTLCLCINTAMPPPNCDDSDCNTEDSYDSTICECVNTPITPPDCDDNNCTTDDSYDALTCSCVNTPITPPDCNDDDCTTADVYNVGTCMCENNPVANTDACDDGDCTTADSYDTDACVCVNDPLPPPNCDDNDCNTDDSYDISTCECINTPITPIDCDDSDCNTEDMYDAATCACINTPIAPPTCDDNDCTTQDSYDAVACNCLNLPIPPPSCDDNDCSTTDTYNTTTCLCENIVDTPPSCDDNDCTTADSYDSVNCACVNTPITPPTCNTNCALGDITAYDATTCNCEVVTVSIVGCDDPFANNYNPDVNCPDNSCTYDGVDISIMDPCDCASTENIDMDNDGIIDLVADLITINGPAGDVWSLTLNPVPTATDILGMPLATDGSITATEVSAGVYELLVYHPANGTGYGPVTFTSTGGFGELQIGNVEGCDCTPCEPPTPGSIDCDE